MTPSPAGEGPVTGFFHAGVTVTDLDRSLTFYRDLLGMEVSMDRVFTEPYIFEIVALQPAAMRIAYLKIPQSSVIVELIEFQGIEGHPGSARPCDPGTGHFCLYVRDVDALHARLTANGFRSRSAAPVTITAGPNRGSKVVYVSDPDGYLVELFERRTAPAVAEGRPV
jgi:catechol 2,3-dioxygenase-like lactoylglutathione lyase family enzyme